MSKEEALRLIQEAVETGATRLDLGLQGLTKLPPELFQLSNLTTLYLNGNQLAVLPPQIVQLNNLTRFDLSGNQLSTLPPELFQLTNLELLDVSRNQLDALPPEIMQLTKLTWLGLGGLCLSLLPQEIIQLTNLEQFYLHNNQFNTLPSQVFQLTNLTSFWFSRNHIAALPSEIVQLTNLTLLDLSDNNLSELPLEIIQLTKLEELGLDNTPLTLPPYELAIQGIEAIREYFTALEEGGQELAEVKIILVGEGASGKTSLTRCLRGQCFNEHEQTTHGIRIKDWQIDTPERLIRCKLWDFGGQEIMHATHQFFLSRRCLYVLVLDGRRDERPEYWLRYIESFGGGSPVLVVLNKYDSNPSFDLNRPFLQEKYPFIKGFWRTSCKTGNLITEFKEALRKELADVPLTKNQWPASWFRAKARLEEMDEPRIRYEKFEAACREAGVQGEISRNVLVDFLHDLGAVIHFKDFRHYIDFYKPSALTFCQGLNLNLKL